MPEDATKQDHSTIDAESLADAYVQRMLAHNLPLKRQTYIRLRYGDDLPEQWTYQQEIALPPLFRDTNAFFTREALQGLGRAIGVTYLGETPK